MSNLRKNKKIISASILSANCAFLGKEVKKVTKAGADWIHIDVMDNHFVPNLTFGPLLCRSIKEYILTNDLKTTLDLHLMVQPVDELIKRFAESGADYITIHPETTKDLSKSLELIKSYGAKPGLAINPNASIEIIRSVYRQLDLILVMSVYPGFAGQKFIDHSLNQIHAIKLMLTELNHWVPISVDGGINPNNIDLLAKAGIDIFVAGTSIFGEKNNNYRKAIVDLRKSMEYDPK